METKYDDLLRKGNIDKAYEKIKEEYFSLLAKMINDEFELDTSWMTERELNECYMGHFPYFQVISNINSWLDINTVFPDSSKEDWQGNLTLFAHHQKIAYYQKQIEHIKNQYNRYKQIKENLKKTSYKEEIRRWKEQLPISYRQFLKKATLITEPLYKADQINNVIKNHTYAIPDGDFYDVISMTESMVLFYLENVQRSYEST